VNGQTKQVVVVAVELPKVQRAALVDFAHRQGLVFKSGKPNVSKALRHVIAAGLATVSSNPGGT